MTKIPQLKATEIIKSLQRLGFSKVRTTGSHLRMSHTDGRKVTVPLHSKPIAKGTLKSILRQARIGLDDLLEKL